MLHHYQTVSKRRIPCIGLTEEHPPETEVLILLYNINLWLGAAPAVYSSAEGKTVYILYEDTAFLIDDFLESFSPLSLLSAILGRYALLVQHPIKKPSGFQLNSCRRRRNKTRLLKLYSKAFRDKKRTLCRRSACRLTAPIMKPLLKYTAFSPA